MPEVTYEFPNGITIGELIDVMEKHPELSVMFEFGWATPGSVDSWRGSYDQAALGFTVDRNMLSTEDLLRRLKHSLNESYHGYKGGEYIFTRNTRLHVDNWGNSSHTEIVSIEADSWHILLKTATLEH